MNKEHFKYIEKRHKIYHHYNNFFKEIKKNNNSSNKICLNEKKNTSLMNFFKEIYKIGSLGKYGDVYKLCKTNNKFLKNSCVAVKLIPLTDEAYTNKNNTIYSQWREIKVFELVTKLVRKWNCQNFPMLYSYFICDKCSYNNPEINKESKLCLIVLTEISDYDLYNWILEKDKYITKKNKNKNFMIKYEKILLEEWYNIFFQVSVAIYILQTKYQIIHNDLHYKNILVDKIKKGGYWVYQINGIRYYLPNLGFIIKITDFGKCTSITNFNLNLKDIKKIKKGFSDKKFNSIYDINRGIDLKRFSQINDWIISKDNIKNKDIIPKEFYFLLEIIKNDPYINPDNFIKKFMIKYLHNKIGEQVSNNDLKNIIKKNKNVMDFKKGDIVAFQHDNIFKYALVYDIIDDDLEILINKNKFKLIKKNFDDVYIFNDFINQSLYNKKQKYLRENKLGIFII